MRESETGLMKRRAALGAVLALPLVAMVGLAGCAQQKPGSEFVGNWRQLREGVRVESSVFWKIEQDDQGLRMSSFQFGVPIFSNVQFAQSSEKPGLWTGKGGQVTLRIEDGFLIVRALGIRGREMQDTKYERFRGEIPGATR